mmetsp:Transcript_63690/g.197655  ORF Transcript_63690/g.197655 Transcript_63690/m.197655 type:complete len:103 (+) Transcript_63690:1434-1742(+)
MVLFRCCQWIQPCDKAWRIVKCLCRVAAIALMFPGVWLCQVAELCVGFSATTLAAASMDALVIQAAMEWSLPPLASCACAVGFATPFGAGSVRSNRDHEQGW